MNNNTEIELCKGLQGQPNRALVDLIQYLDTATSTAFKHRPSSRDVQEYCNATLNMSLLKDLPIVLDEYSQVLQGMFNYIGIRFGDRAVGTCIVMDHVLTVKGITANVVSGKITVDQFISDLDLAIHHALKQGTFNQHEFSVLVGTTVTNADASTVLPGNEAELIKRLVEYVTTTLNPQSASTVSIGGELFTFDTKTPNIDSMLRSKSMAATQDMFRPFLVRSIYSHLVDLACAGQTTTYEAIANAFGLPNRGNQLGSTLSPLLSSIYHFCRTHQQPFLTSIVVRKSGEDMGLPGKGFWDLYQATEDRHERRTMTLSLHESVFAYWSALGK